MHSLHTDLDSIPLIENTWRGSGPVLIEEHWPGPPTSLALVLRLAGYKRAKTLTAEPPPA